MESLRVPYGLNEAGDLIPAYSADKGSVYRCPCCGVQLIHRAGEIRAKHFSHPPASNCNLESVLHITAKRLVHAAIKENASGGQKISLEHCCQNCGIVFTTSLPGRTFSDARLEVKVGDYICDVVGYRGKEIGLAVEIFNTHQVDSRKASGLMVHWVELTAEDVIEDAYQWRPTQAHLKESFCKSCKDQMRHIIEVADKYGIDRSLYSPVKNPGKATYVAETETCFKCKQEIPVFWWKGVPFCESEPPNPRPKTIKYRKSKQYGGSYWANTCANCNMIQGDNFLFIFPNAPFKGMPSVSDSQERHAGVKIVTGKAAETEFMKTLNRSFNRF